MTDSLVSVIIPVYNVEKYLSQCLESVINQTYKNLEIVVIDDGSTDNSGQICDSFGKADSRIVVIHSENRGVSVARNIGIQNAHGEFISFVDSDDFLDEDFYEYLVSLIRIDNCDIAYCSYRKIYNDEPVNSEKSQIKKSIVLTGREAAINALRLRKEFGLVIWNGLYKASKITKFTEGQVIAEDQSVAMRALLDSNMIVKGFEKKYNYRIRMTGSKSVNLEQRITDTVGAIEAINLMLPLNDQELQKAYNIRAINTYFRLMDRYCNTTKKNRELFMTIRNGIVHYSKLAYGNLGWLVSFALRLNESIYRAIFFMNRHLRKLS